jgi:hypothetical protein
MHRVIICGYQRFFGFVIMRLSCYFDSEKRGRFFCL